MRILLIAFIPLLFSCQSQPGTNNDKKGADGDSSSPAQAQKGKLPSTFLDSIAGKYDLAIDQIKKHTTISKYDYSDTPYVSFKGDTVLRSGSDFSTAIILHSGRNCLNKILVVMRSDNGQGIDCMDVRTECDRDESSGYRETDYMILNDSVFETIETYTKAHQDAPDETTVTRWRIGKTGKIDSIPQNEYAYLPTSFSARFQFFNSFIKNVKQRNIDWVMKQCSLPFGQLWMTGGEVISENQSLREQLQQHFQKKYFDEMMVGKPAFDFTDNTIRYLSRDYNKDGELESESTFSFLFKSEKDGSLKLYDIVIAG